MPLKYPVIPLKNIVVFPKLVTPLFIGRDISIAALEEATANNNIAVFCLQKQHSEANVTAESLNKIGVLGNIITTTPIGNNLVKIQVEGINRVLLTEMNDSKPFIETDIKSLADINNFNSNNKQKEAINQVYLKLKIYLTLNKNIPTESIKEIIHKNEVLSFIYHVAYFMMFSIEDKQSIIEIDSLKERLTFLDQLINKELDILGIEEKLHNNVKEQIEKSQKEFYLKEKIKAIKTELGDNDFDDISEYTSKLTQLNLPEEVQKKANVEINRLRKFSTMSTESGLIKTYLDWLFNLPWNQHHKKTYELRQVLSDLDKHHYGLDSVKNRIKEFLAVYKLTNHIGGSILCLVGSSGVGKTSIAKTVAEVMGRKYHRISLGGLNDEAELRGHRRTYVGSMPGRIIQGIRSTGSKNPVILLDEIDKLSSNFQSNPSAVLLEILDPEQNNNFYDHYLEVPFDLSDVVFIATANQIQNIPAPLLSRMELMEIPGYTLEEKTIIAKKHILPKLKKQHGLQFNEFELTDEIIQDAINKYTKEAGLRQLEKILANLIRKAVVHILEKKKLKITKENLSKYLNKTPYKTIFIPKKPEIGLSLGLAYTDHGGEVMPIEASIFEGKGELKLTGKMGDVMQESAQTALSYVRSLADSLQLPKEFYNKYDIHIHLPENAIPKDGPSAGVAVLTALVSCFTGIPVLNTVATTGEITLHGKVLPVGGLREKLIAAFHHKLEKVFIPADNLIDLESIKDNFISKLTVIPINSMQEIIGQILVEDPYNHAP